MSLAAENRIRKITIDQLEPGMFVHDLNCGWLDHPFMFSRFLVDDESKIAKIRAHGVRALYIDPLKGRDVSYAPRVAEVRQDFTRRVRSLAEIREAAAARPVSIEEERTRATRLYRDAGASVRDFFAGLRQGSPRKLESIEMAVERVVNSVRRQPDALVPLTRRKSIGGYAHQHPVASAALMTAFGERLKLDTAALHEIALGAMLQDVGMTTLPDELLGKATRLSRDEFSLVTGHVHRGDALLEPLAELPSASRDVIIHHHERIDGSGYPEKLSGSAISLHGQMAAVVDVYDALTSDRPHHKALIPTVALQRLYEWSEHHFSRELVQQFIRTVGIYPVGSLVQLKSGYLGVVVDQHEKELLRPRVRLFFNPNKNIHVRPQTIRIGFGAGAAHGPIVRAESWERWKLDPSHWLPA